MCVDTGQISHSSGQARSSAASRALRRARSHTQLTSAATKPTGIATASAISSTPAATTSTCTASWPARRSVNPPPPECWWPGRRRRRPLDRQRDPAVADLAVQRGQGRLVTIDRPVDPRDPRLQRVDLIGGERRRQLVQQRPAQGTGLGQPPAGAADGAGDVVARVRARDDRGPGQLGEPCERLLQAGAGHAQRERRAGIRVAGGGHRRAGDVPLLVPDHVEHLLGERVDPARPGRQRQLGAENDLATGSVAGHRGGLTAQVGSVARRVRGRYALGRGRIRDRARRGRRARMDAAEVGDRPGTRRAATDRAHQHHDGGDHARHGARRHQPPPAPARRPQPPPPAARPYPPSIRE